MPAAAVDLTVVVGRCRLLLFVVRGVCFWLIVCWFVLLVACGLLLLCVAVVNALASVIVSWLLWFAVYDFTLLVFIV